MSKESPSVSGTFHWVEGRYRRDDFAVFARRYYVPVDQRCPTSAEDASGAAGTLIEGSCIEVNKGCFIATAAFESELDSRVKLLRHFRDDILLQSDLRASFTKVLGWYYSFSPPIAAVMKKRRAVKLLLKWIMVYPTLLFVRTFVALLRATHKDWRKLDRVWDIN